MVRNAHSSQLEYMFTTALPCPEPVEEESLLVCWSSQHVVLGGNLMKKGHLAELEMNVPTSIHGQF